MRKRKERMGLSNGEEDEENEMVVKCSISQEVFSYETTRRHSAVLF